MEKFGKSLDAIQEDNKAMRQEQLERKRLDIKVEQRQLALETQVQEIWHHL